MSINKIIIAGGRSHEITAHERRFIISVLNLYGVSVVITGGCRGVDTHARFIANARNVRVIQMFADWDRYGKSAGPRRNRDMARAADAVILLPGGRGTADMEQAAIKHGLPIMKPTDRTVVKAIDLVTPQLGYEPMPVIEFTSYGVLVDAPCHPVGLMQDYVLVRGWNF